MRKKLIVYIVFFITGSLSAQRADDIIGKYQLPNNLDIEIFKNNDKFHGKIIALNGYKNGRKVDCKNPDKSKRKDLLLGKVIINDLEFDKEKRTWINGKMYGPEKGLKFNLKIIKMKEKEIEVVGSKYFFWKTIVWKKLL